MCIGTSSPSPPQLTINREENNIPFSNTAISVCVQKMVRSDLASSGVMFTIDTESGNPDVVVINAAFGLGENVVQGAVNPDEYYVFKETVSKAGKDGKLFRPIISKVVGTKNQRMAYKEDGGVVNVPVTKHEQRTFCLTDDEVLLLARWGCVIEDHYSSRASKRTPMDIEWAKDGQSNQLFIVQVRVSDFGNLLHK